MTSGLAERIAALPPEKRLLLERMRGGAGTPVREEAGTPPTPPFSLVTEEDRARMPAGVEDAYPLAGVQHGMLFHMHATLDDPVPAYHNVFQFEVLTEVDVRLLARALEHLLARHTILRTAFELTRFGEPLQLVYERVPVELPVVDFGRLSDDAARRELDSIVRTENRRILDLSRPPLMRIRLFRRTDDRWYLTITECHAIAEGWSTLITFRELQESYFALRRGEELPPPEPPGALYRDFVRMEREAIGSAECREFWRRQLDGARVARLPRWPRAWRRPARSADRKRRLDVPAEVLDGLQRLARDQQVPLKSVLLAVHLHVVRTLVGRDDLLTGLQVHGRPEGGDGEHVLGLFVNTVPLRIDASGGDWAALVRRAFAAERDLMPHRRYPLAALQRSWGREPLIDSAFAFLHFHLFDERQPWQGSPVRGVGGGDLSVTHFPMVSIFSLREGSPRTLVLWLEHDDSEIAPAQLRAIQDLYRGALASAAAGAGRSPLLPARERHRLTVEWSDGGADGETVGVQRAVADRAQRVPDAVALVRGGGSPEIVTFGALRRRSAALARRLRARGVGRGDRIGVCAERSPRLVVAILGILEAGAAFVPLDPEHPAERRAWIARDAGLALTLVERAAGPLGPADAAPVVAIEDLDAEPEPPSASDPAPSGPEELAYVIYTSGSTGRPKGVMVSHRGLSAYLSWSVETYRLAEGRGAPVHSSIAVDMTVTSLLAPLIAGTPVRLLPGLLTEGGLEELALHGGDLSLVKLTPSHLELLDRLMPEGRWAGWARHLVLGGEQLLGERLAALREAAPRLRVINEYGPTETVVGCVAHEVEAASAPRSGPVPIGRPVAGARVFLCDARLEPVPTGTPGEIVIGGPGVARGYLGAPALTAERFVPDPFGSPGGRLYRTGDLATHRPDGQAVYLGRGDQQVKIRGHRVEPGEIEAALRAHPEVGEAVVAVLGAGGEARRLTAWIVPAGDRASSVSELRGFLRARLPEFMVPGAYVVLDRLPLTAAGKVDRSALPEPAGDRPELDVEMVPPRSELEAEIAAIWRSVLGLDRIGVEDNFFDLGGDSLQLLQVQLRTRERTGRSVAVTDVFRHPTIASLAVFLADGDAGDEAADRRTEARAGRRLAAATRGAAVRRRRRSARERLGGEG